MTTPSVVLRVALFAAAWAGAAALAQTPAPLPDLPPSAASGPRGPASAPTGPRLRTPAETGKRATAPGDLSPERPVAPQVTIPFGKNPPPARTEPRARRGTPPPPTAGGVDDSAARCEAQQDEQERAVCRAKLAREARTRLPN